MGDQRTGLGCCPFTSFPHRFIAPELLIAECSNTLWKRARTQEMSAEVVGLAIKLIQADALEIVPMRPLMEAAIGLALAIDHPAYDCLFAALALREQCPFITADVKFLRKARGRGIEVMTLEEAALATR